VTPGAVYPAGRAAGLEAGHATVLGQGYGQAGFGPAQKMFAHIAAGDGQDPCPSVQDGASVTADQLGGRARRGQAAELFGADRQPDGPGQAAAAGRRGLGLAIIAGTIPHEAGTYENGA